MKRSYVPELAPAAPAGRIRPFGLNYSCRTSQAIAAVLRLSLLSNLKPNGFQSFLRSPAPEHFELPADPSPDLRIVFSTRLWPPDQIGPNDNPADVNGFRIVLVGRLRKAFGERFVGGIIPSDEGYQVCPELRTMPELLVNIPHIRTAYAKSSRGPAIGIYTRGLHGSNGFKLAEYLASSKCIIGQTLAHQLPEPLGESHRVRNDFDAILAECDRMLTDTSELKEIQQMSWRYYQRNIRYDGRMQLLFSGLEPGSPADAGRSRHTA